MTCVTHSGEKKLFVRTYGKAEDEKKKVHGYKKSTDDEADDGYKHYDSFHKKNGDKYGYETFASYGSAQHKEDAAGGKEQGEKGECKF